MRTRQEIKLLAKQGWRAQWAMCTRVTLVYMLISSAVSLIQLIYSAISPMGPLINLLSFLGSLFTIFVGSVLGVGYSYAMLQVYTGQQTEPHSLFAGFDEFGRNLGAMLLMAVFIMLWSFLFIIPGIIMAVAYSMVPFILADNRRIGVMDALRMSKRITRGFKGEIFMMMLSFFGWTLLFELPYVYGMMQATFNNTSANNLIALCGCIVYMAACIVFLSPYMQASYAGLYLELKQRALSTGVISPEEF